MHTLMKKTMALDEAFYRGNLIFENNVAERILLSATLLTSLLNRFVFYPHKIFVRATIKSIRFDFSLSGR